MLSAFQRQKLFAMARLYSRTDAGRRAWDTQNSVVPLDCRRVLGFVSKDTATGEIREKLGWSEAALDEILKELEDGGLVKSVDAGPDKNALDFTDSFLIADLKAAAATKPARGDLDFTGSLSTDALRAANKKT